MSVTELYAPTGPASQRWHKLMRVWRRVLILLRRRSRRARRLDRS